ncbi:MAG: hypothetical protein KGD74_11870 [Candidatus Lokiarchaeota archaeon]|nr:hypothetical protein [Candidatus Lokiarchaeota archaeon]
MTNESKSELTKELKSEYHKKLKELELRLAAKHKELNQIERTIQHESKKIYGSTLMTLSKLKTKKVEVNGIILKLKKEIKRIRNEYLKNLKKI